MSKINVDFVNELLKPFNVVVTEDTPISYEYRAFNVRDCKADSDIIIRGGHDIDGDVADIFTIGDNRYTFPSLYSVALTYHLDNAHVHA